MSLSSYDIHYPVYITVYMSLGYTQNTLNLKWQIHLGLAGLSYQQAETKGYYYSGESLFLICTDCKIKRGSSLQLQNGEDRK